MSIKNLNFCLMILICIFGQSAFSQSNDVITDTQTHVESPKVEVHKPKDSFEPYKYRRDETGWMINIASEYFYPKNFVSQNQAVDYETVWGKSSMSIYGFELERTWNVTGGAISFGVGYKSGQISNVYNSEDNTLQVSFQTASLGYYLTVLNDEPRFVPYVNFIFRNESVKETTATLSYSKTLGYANNYKVGALIQLNNFDDTVARRSYLEYGLENAYIDLFITQYFSSSNEDSINLSTDLSYGYGIRIEF